VSISLHLFASGRASEADISPRGYELVAYGITDNFNYPEKQWDLFSKPYSAGPWIAEDSSRGLTPNERDRDATTAKH
jgi:hypothetical protein